MKHEHLIRPATPEDAAACAAIYAPYVRETTISFEEEPPTPDEMATRMASAQQGHAWLVLEDDSGRVVGYAYGNRLGVRAAYRWSCEVSVYLDQERRGKGGGRALYEELLQRLEDRGYRQAMALVSVPNEASDRLHKAMASARWGCTRTSASSTGGGSPWPISSGRWAVVTRLPNRGEVANVFKQN